LVKKKKKRETEKGFQVAALQLPTREKTRPSPKSEDGGRLGGPSKKPLVQVEEGEKKTNECMRRYYRSLTKTPELVFPQKGGPTKRKRPTVLLLDYPFRWSGSTSAQFEESRGIGAELGGESGPNFPKQTKTFRRPIGSHLKKNKSTEAKEGKKKRGTKIHTEKHPEKDRHDTDKWDSPWGEM